MYWMAAINEDLELKFFHKTDTIEERTGYILGFSRCKEYFDLYGDYMIRYPEDVNFFVSDLFDNSVDNEYVTAQINLLHNSAVAAGYTDEDMVP